MKKLFLLMAVCLPMFIFTACNNDDDDEGGSVSGLYKADNGSYKGEQYLHVYNFINSNTVIDYGTVSNSSQGWGSVTLLSQIPGHSGWYYAVSAMREWTYYTEGNKIYITKGEILTISGNTLIPDGSSLIYTKW